MKNQFEVNNNLSHRNTFHIVTLENCTNKKVKAIFGELPEGCDKDTKYSEFLVLTHKNKNAIEARRDKFGKTVGSGIYTLYTSYGVWRIGGFEKDDQYIKELIELLNN